MDIKAGLEQQLKVAELYKAQGLYTEAKKAYDMALDIVQANPRIKNRDQIQSIIVQKIKELKLVSEKVESAPATPEMTPQVQTLIKNLFSFSADADPDVTALEGAVALAKFGQVERAVFEFNSLLKRDSVRVAAAKNILRCYQLLSLPEKAVDIYQEWLSNTLFSPTELLQVRHFLEAMFKRDGNILLRIRDSLPEDKSISDHPKLEPPDVLDIGSIVINLDNGPLKGKPIELDVQLQARNTVSLFIESKEKSLLDNLNVGFRLKNIQFNSTVAIFRGEGVISAKALINSGPKQGEYHLDIKIEDSRDRIGS
jgi:tetratricopeptide (TPR) repeat protein